MDLKQKVINILEENMTDRGFRLWKGIDQKLPNIWNYPTSSTGKYHRKSNGEITTQAEHIYDMLFAASKIFKMFNFKPKTVEADIIMFIIALHDSLKYGSFGSRKHTDNGHDKEAADMIESNRGVLKKLFTDEQITIISEAIRFHSGRWSTDVPIKKPFTFHDHHPITLFIHTLDMLSTYDLLQTDVRNS
jgi:hypothetical protein